MSEQKRSDYLHMRIHTPLKKRMQQEAAAQGMTLTGWIIQTCLAAITKKGS